MLPRKKQSYPHAHLRLQVNEKKEKSSNLQPFDDTRITQQVKKKKLQC